MLIWPLQIYFQWGDFTNEGSAWLVDLIVAAIGAFLGVWGAWQTYLIQVRRERNDTLRYTVTLFRSVMEKVERQADHCSSFAGQDFGHSTGVEQMPIIINTDLNRLVNSADQQKIFHAFRKRYHRTADSLKTFSNIYNALDFLYELLKQIGDFYQKEQELFVGKKRKYFELLDKAEEHMAIATLDDQLPEPLKTFFGERIKAYVEAKEQRAFNGDIRLGMTIMVEPTIPFILNGYKFIPACIDIAASLRSAGVTLDLIRQQSAGLKKSFEAYAAQLKKANVQLASDAQQLLNDFR